MYLTAPLPFNGSKNALKVDLAANRVVTREKRDVQRSSRRKSCVRPIQTL